MVLVRIRILTVFLNKSPRIPGELYVICIANNNIQIGVLRMMKVIDFPAFQKIKLLSECTDVSCFYIYDSPFKRVKKVM